MDQEAEKLVILLEPAIRRKCLEIREARAEENCGRIFTILCLLVVIVPTGMVFLGTSLNGFLTLFLFAVMSLLMLSPLLMMNLQGGCSDE